VEQWLAAGKHAAARSAHLEAIGHFGRGLSVLGSLPETARRDRQEIELLLAQGSSLLTAKGMSSAEAADVYVRARDLCAKTGDADRLFVALWNSRLITAMSDLGARPDRCRTGC
jgi:predicted ATPase